MQKFLKDEEFFTVQQVARRLNLSSKTIYRYLDEGLLDKVMIGKNIRILSSSIKKIIKIN